MRKSQIARLGFLAFATAAAWGAVGSTSAATAAAGNAGPAVVVASADAGSSRRSGGGSGTTFSLRLPAGASCPGDSTNDGYRVQSFLVPAAVDVGTLTYYSVSPRAPSSYALYDVYTNPYIQEQTANATAPGQPGPIINIPNFNFAVFPPGRLPPGRYHVGIACSLHNDTVKFWATDLLLTAAPKDQPAHLRWTVADAPAPGHKSHRTPVLIFGAGAVVVVGVIAISRRHSAGRFGEGGTR